MGKGLAKRSISKSLLRILIIGAAIWIPSFCLTLQYWRKEESKRLKDIPKDEEVDAKLREWQGNIKPNLNGGSSTLEFTQGNPEKDEQVDAKLGERQENVKPAFKEGSSTLEFTQGNTEKDGQVDARLGERQENVKPDLNGGSSTLEFTQGNTRKDEEVDAKLGERQENVKPDLKEGPSTLEFTQGNTGKDEEVDAKLGERQENVEPNLNGESSTLEFNQGNTRKNKQVDVKLGERQENLKPALKEGSSTSELIQGNTKTDEEVDAKLGERQEKVKPDLNGKSSTMEFTQANTEKDEQMDAELGERQENVKPSVKGGPSPLEFTQGIYPCEEDAKQTYTVCNGFSNQLLGHAGNIANLIMLRRRVAIPDVFIFNGVQNESDGIGSLKNVFATKDNSIPLTSIIDGHTLQKKIISHGVGACFIPHHKVVSSNQTMKCSWLDTLQDSDSEIEYEILDAMKPSLSLSDIVETILLKLQEKSSKLNLADGVCLHHRDGPDWHNYCALWKGGNNCMNVDDRAIEDLVKDRIPPHYANKWMYYVGDAPPSAMLTDKMKNRTDLELLHRGRDNLLDNIKLQKLLGNVQPSLEKTIDAFAAVDFFVCNHMPSFIGNSVSTFSALQIAKRRGKNSTWYNSGSNPLLVDFIQVQEIPVVYTYTEESQILGKIFLKSSISSVRRTFGAGIDIHIIYCGTNDEAFLKWLAQRNVIIHDHEPKWLPMIDKMISNADKERSHLYSHRGNYIGTWQRIDIPLFINAEYILFLDLDTVVHAKFDLSTFGLNITPGIAFSEELWEGSKIPSNAGVALFNVPKLRETYNDFIAYIQDHADRNEDFFMGPSDQGAYLQFYHSYKNPGVELNYNASTYVQLLDDTFNMKPYYKEEKNFEQRKIVHYHGLKPHEIMKGLMGYKRDDFPLALRALLSMWFGNDDHHLLCLTLYDFAVSIAEDRENLDLFCHNAFSLVKEEETVCKDFLWELSKKQEDFDCVDLLKPHGFLKDKSLMEESPQVLEHAQYLRGTEG